MGGWVSRAGSFGVDWSANGQTVPISGYALLATIPTKRNRNFIEVQNQSIYTVQIVRDDGTGAQQTSVILGPAGSSPGQGGNWTSDTFKGRLRVFAANASAAVAIYED